MDPSHEVIEMNGLGKDHSESTSDHHIAEQDGDEMEIVESKRFLLSNVSKSTAQVEVVFEHVEYFIGKKKKKILKGISGVFSPGELVVIIGAWIPAFSVTFRLEWERQIDFG